MQFLVKIVLAENASFKAAFHPYVNNLCFVLNLVLAFSVPFLNLD